MFSWCGNGLVLLLKSIGVGLDRFGVGFGASRGEFFYFWPFRLKCIRPKPAKGAQAVVVTVKNIFLGFG